MEVAPRLQSTDRAQNYFGADRQNQDESGPEAEARARRKFQRTTDDNDSFSFRKPTLPASATRPAPEYKAGLINRRRSTIRDNKPLLGPRPLESSLPGKRIMSEGSPAATASSQTQRSFLPSSSSMPLLVDNNNNNNSGKGGSRFSFGGPRAITNRSADSSGSFDFLPPVSFDDFQTSIASYEPQGSPQLGQFPSTADSGKFVDERLGNKMAKNASRDKKSTESTPAIPRQTRAQTLMRRPSNARQEALQLHGGAAQSPASSASLSIRNRRQSQLPASTPAIVNARPPRKSMGPGLLTGMLNSRRNQQEQGPSPPVVNQPSVSRTPSLSNNGRRTTLARETASSGDLPRATMPTQSFLAKSQQVQTRNNQASESAISEQVGKSGSKTAGGKGFLQEPTTPTSSGNKRQSGRMSGLGARTISPTDARRLKRLSMFQNSVPRLKPPPTPQPEPLPDMRSTARSPSLIPRKSSMTPSSARDTPDSGPKQHFPPFTLSASSSHQSLRSLNAAGPPRIAPSPSLSKLPTPKPRNVYSSNERREDEIVPPVPAIPRAYESPKDQIEAPFFSSQKTLAPASASTTPVVGSANSDSAIMPAMEERKLMHDQVDSPGHRRTRTIGTAPPSEKIAPTTPAPRKKPLQPLRLPPLNLLPLSTPTAARIASYPVPSAEVDNREMTPPPKRNFSKTPSTPMTASKASFNRRYEDEQGSTFALRSSTSHHALRLAVDNNVFEDRGNGVPLPIQSNGHRQITPFSSGSMPKSSGEFAPPKRQTTDEYTLGHHVDIQASKPLGPRPRTASKSAKDPTVLTNNLPSNEDSEAPSSGTSLRRKLSLGWRRSSSKNTNRQAAEQAYEQQMQAEMPPPKLPASATWAVSSDGKVQQGQTRSSLDTNRPRPVPTGLHIGSDGRSATRNDRVPSAQNSSVRQLHSDPNLQAPVPRSASWSILGMNRQPGPPAKTAPTAVKDNGVSLPRLDKDDVAANEEMKRLSAKRRDVESAARETDELRKQATPKERMTPAQAIQSSAGLLNIYEKGEIIDFKDGVYFCGTKNAKKHVGDISTAGTTNFGYDDERGDYNICVGDHLAYRYEVVDVLGKGSFGQVVRCIDHKAGGLCAVKIIRNKKRFHQQALVEVNILNKLKEWDPDETHATLTVISSFYFRSHLCIITPCLSINLYELIRAHNFTGFSLPLIRRFARQMLACLRLLQTKRIIHCDLKPENILLCDPRRADIRVIDFGSSCKTDEKVYTYIQSRFYRSPEVILGSEYGLGIDMWSFGCILAELYTGYPIFPGENEQEQLACIMEIFGPPSREIIEKCSRRKLFFDSTMKPRVTVSSKGRRRRPSSKTLGASLKCEDEAFLDFIGQCLRWDPERRLRPDQAGSHAFITNEPIRRIPERPRVRTSAGQNAPAPSGGAPSPVKRVHTTTGPVSTSTTNAFAQTPAKETRSRPLPDTPSTAMRTGMPIRQHEPSFNESPVKSTTASRRQSGLTTGAPLSAAPNLAVAGSKRASNGALLAHGGFNLPTSTSLPRITNNTKADMAGAAARESMGAVTRWR